MKDNIVAVILAAGKGTRTKLDNQNKVTLPFLGKPLITYGVELLKPFTTHLIIVIGAYANTVKKILAKNHLSYVAQRKRLGTAHALKTTLKLLKIWRPSIVLIGYGDHLMFYQKVTIRKLITLHQKEDAVVTFITTMYQNPDKLAWGRIMRDKNQNVLDIIEQKDALREQRKIKEINAGFYCLDYQFLATNLSKIKKSPLTGEYYLTDVVKIAVNLHKKVLAFKIPFQEVGIGINTLRDIEEAEKLYREYHH